MAEEEWNVVIAHALHAKAVAGRMGEDVIFGSYGEAESKEVVVERSVVKGRTGLAVERSVNNDRDANRAKVSVVVEVDEVDLADKRRTTARLEGILLVSRRRR